MKLLLPLFFVFALALEGCGPSLKVTSDFDRTANFTAYKSYTYTSEALQLPIDDLNRRRILDAIDTELAAKGFSKAAEGGDVLIDIKLIVQERKEAYATTSGGGGMYGAGYPYRWGGGFSTTSINVETYHDGTLIIDMVDASKKQLVWQGRGMKTLDPDASSELREERINYAVKQIFTKYPPQITKK